MDVVIVHVPDPQGAQARRKWGGQCIVFIDEIDAVGHAPPGARAELGCRHAEPTTGFDEPPFYGPMGRADPDRRPRPRDPRVARADVRTRAPSRRSAATRPSTARAGASASTDYIGSRAWAAGGGLALNQLLVQMDGVDEPPFMRKFFTNRLNTFLDAIYIVPRKIGRLRLRLRPPQAARRSRSTSSAPRNVPIDALDPALIRPGRMGRHIWFRTPTKDDRQDIFDLYLGKVDHEPDLDTDRAPRRAGAHHQRLLAGDDRAGAARWR